MPKYIFGDAKLDIGGIGPERVAAKVSELSIGVRVVQGIVISRALDITTHVVATLRS